MAETPRPNPRRWTPEEQLKVLEMLEEFEQALQKRFPGACFGKIDWYPDGEPDAEAPLQ